MEWKAQVFICNHCSKVAVLMWLVRTKFGICPISENLLLDLAWTLRKYWIHENTRHYEELECVKAWQQHIWEGNSVIFLMPTQGFNWFSLGQWYYYQAMLITLGLGGPKHSAENLKTFGHGTLEISSPQETKSNQLVCLLRYLGMPFYGYIQFNSIQ